MTKKKTTTKATKGGKPVVQNIENEDNKAKKKLFDEIFSVEDQLDDVDPEDAEAIDDLRSRKVHFSDDVSSAPSKAAKHAIPIRTQSDLDESLTTGAYSGKSVKRNDLYDDFGDEDLSELQTSEYMNELKEAQKVFEYEQEGFERGSDEEESDDEGAEKLQSHLDLLSEENKFVLKGVQNERARQKQKAQAVFNQKMLYDQLLKARILIQKPLTVANQLPQTDDLFECLEAAGEVAQKSCVEIRSTLFDMLCDCLNMQNQLFNQNSESSEDNTKQISGDNLIRIKNKRRRIDPSDSETDLLDEVWEVLNDSYDQYSKYRANSIEKWNQRTRIQTAVSYKQFKVMNTDIVTQVSNALKDQRLINRTRVKRFPEKILGKRQREEEEEETEESEITDEEIFDDKDFYQTLLRDLISDVGSAFENKDTNLRTALQRNAKEKKVYESRKKYIGGRTIEYKVHEKLVNFMTAEESEIPKSAETLFMNLFGGGTVIMEEEEDSDSEENGDATEQAVEDDNEPQGKSSFEDEDLSSFMQ